MAGLKIPCGPNSGTRTPSKVNPAASSPPRQHLAMHLDLRAKPLERRQSHAPIQLQIEHQPRNTVSPCHSRYSRDGGAFGGKRQAGAAAPSIA